MNKHTKRLFLSDIEKQLIKSGEKVVISGKTVVKRNEFFSPYYKDALGRTNIERMRSGFAPIGNDGKIIELHHLQQKDDGIIFEITSTMHRKNSKDLHRYTDISEIDRQAFNNWKRQYWAKRSEDFS